MSERRMKKYEEMVGSEMGKVDLYFSEIRIVRSVISKHRSTDTVYL